MSYRPEAHHRRSIRLKGYDYTTAGAYFITVVAHCRQRLFGDIVDGRMRLSPLGEIARDEWLNSAARRPDIALDAFVVMPDHFHGIVVIRGRRPGDGGGIATDRRGAARRAPTIADIDTRTSRRAPIGVADIDPRTSRRTPIGTTDIDTHTAHRAPIHPTEHFGRPVPGSIPTIVRSFKAAVTKRINECRGTPGSRVWQRNYYERIIRDQAALRRTRAYLVNNPAKG